MTTSMTSLPMTPRDMTVVLDALRRADARLDGTGAASTAGDGAAAPAITREEITGLRRRLGPAAGYTANREELECLARFWVSKAWGIRLGRFYYEDFVASDDQLLALAADRLERISDVIGPDAVARQREEVESEEREKLGPILWGVLHGGSSREWNAVAEDSYACMDRPGGRVTLAGTPRPGLPADAGTAAEPATVPSGAALSVGIWLSEWAEALRFARNAGWLPAGTVAAGPIRRLTTADLPFPRWNYDYPRGQQVAQGDAVAFADALEKAMAKCGEAGRFAQVIALCRASDGFVVNWA